MDKQQLRLLHVMQSQASQAAMVYCGTANSYVHDEVQQHHTAVGV